MISADEFMRRNSRLILATAAVLVVVSLAATLFGTAWTDEVFYVAPGANWALGKGFTSNDWSNWGESKTWGLSNPGLPVLIGLWFKAFGFGQIQAHAFIFLVYLAGLIGLVRWVGQRHQLTTLQMAVGVLVGLFVHSFNHDAIYHARPDCFWPLLFWWFLRISLDEWENTTAQLLEGTLFGAVCVFLGLHFCGFFAAAAATLYLFYRNKRLFYAGLGQAIGLIVGLLLLQLAYDRIGIWEAFVKHRSMHFAQPLRWTHWAVSRDFWLIGPSLAGLLLVELLSVRGVKSETAKAAVLGLGMFAFIPPVIHTIGYYQAAYSWMVIAPVCLVLLPVLVRRPSGISACFNGTILILMVGGILVRSADVAQGILETRRRHDVGRVVARLIPEADPVLVSTCLYYELGSRSGAAYICYDHMLPSPADVPPKVRWMVLSRVDAKIMEGKLGGSWEVQHSSPTGSLMMPYGNYVVMRRLP